MELRRRLILLRLAMNMERSIGYVVRHYHSSCLVSAFDQQFLYKMQQATDLDTENVPF